MSSLKAQGTKAFIWDFMGKMATYGTGFVVSIFLARLLEPSDFGLVAMMMVIISIAGIFSDVGLGGALIQRQRVRPIHYSSVFYFNIFVGLLLALLTYFSAPMISEFYGNEQLLPLAEVLSLLFVINAFSSVQNARLRKDLNYALLAKVSFISSLVSGTIGISLAFLGAGVWSLVAQALSMGVVYNILIWSTANWMPGMIFSWKALVQLWGYGFRMFLSGFLNTVYTQLDFIIIGKLFAPATLGFFERAKSLHGMAMQYSSSSLMAVLFPVLSKVQKDLPRFQNIVLKSLGIISFVTFVVIGGLYLISHELIVLLYGQKWLPSIYYFKILILSGFAYPVSALLVNVLSSRGNSKAFLRLEIYKKLIGSISLIVLYFFGIEMFLYALIVQAFINGYILNILYASREISVPFIKFSKPLITQAVIAVVSVTLTTLFFKGIAFSDIIMILIKGTLFLVLYVGFSYLFKTSSFRYFLEQTMPLIRKKLVKRSKG